MPPISITPTLVRNTLRLESDTKNPAERRGSVTQYEAKKPAKRHLLTGFVNTDTGTRKADMIGIYRASFSMCAGHGTILAGESPATGSYRQV